MQRLETIALALLRLADRLLPALLMAASVTLLAAGLLWYGSPTATGGDLAYAARGPQATAVLPGDPGKLPTPGVVPTPGPASSLGPGASPPASPAPTVGPGQTGLPGASPTPATPPVVAVATRVVIPSLNIDLPVVSRDLEVPNQGPDQYPPCDVAIYHTAFEQPGETGTTYLYGHARDGMFLPLLTASETRNGASLVGALVEVYTDDNRRYVYTISLVKRHATDFSIAENVPAGESQVVLQTSEGPRGTLPKLQVLAQFQDVLDASQADAHPKPKPRPCYDTP
jgi:hypothetical protein